MDVTTGDVIHACRADETVFPASLTKLMTLYLTFEALEEGLLTLDQELTVSAAAERQPRVKLGLKKGASITVEQAIYALVTHSANDVATVIAEAMAGTEDNFAIVMTRKAQDLGMADTLFRNASGLPNREQVTSTRDMAKLAKAIWQTFPDRYAYFATKTFTFDGEEFKSHNGLLESYPGADGIKTGYTRASGFNLVSSAARDGQRLIAVVIGGNTAKSRDRYMEQILDYGFIHLANAKDKPTAPACRFR